MGEKRNVHLGILRTGLQKIFLLFCIILLTVTGCTTVPTPEQMSKQREENARQDVELIKPAMKYGNFGESALTLEDAIRYALENNLELRVQRLKEEIAKESTMVEKLGMLPSLKADASWRRRDVLRKSDVYNWLIDQDQPDYTVSELKENWWANLVLTWNVLDTMMAYVRAGEMELKEEVLKQQRIRQSQNLALDVTRAYWHAAAVEDALDYVHVVEDNLKKVKKNMETAVGAGSIDNMAAKDAEMRLKELELTIRQLQSNLSKERLELAQLMGLNQNVQFTLARPPIKPIISALPHTKELDIDRLEEYALLHRPELFISDLEVMIQKEEAKNKILAMFPGISVFAGTHYEDNRLLLSNNWNTIGAGVGLELLDLPARYVAYKGQLKSVEMAKAQRLMTTVGVITQVHLALLDYAVKVDRFRLLDETYSLSTNLFQMAQTKNQAGRLPELAVTQRHLEEMAAKLRRDESVVDMLVAHKRLCVTIGVDPLECDKGVLSSGRPGTGYDYTPTTGLRKWKCLECGYIHTGSEPPEKCPICGVGRDAFVEVSDSAGTTPVTSYPSSTITSSNVEDVSGWGEGSSPPPMLPGDDVARSTATPGMAGPASDRFLWKVQIGAFAADSASTNKRISEINAVTRRLFDNRDTEVTTTRVNGKLVKRVRMLGLTESQARELARNLESQGLEAWVIPPHSSDW